MKKNVCVFCGSRHGTNPEWTTLADALGKGIAQRGWKLIFGGGGSGLMGAVANATLQNKGEVVGIIPKGLTSEEPVITNLTELHIVKTMRERKEMMDDFSDAFVIIPGGIGTLEELFEVWTARQVGFHDKPVILANWNGYYDKLLEFIHQSHRDGFLTQSHLAKLEVVNTLEEIFESLEK